MNLMAPKLENFYAEKETAYFDLARTDIASLLPERAARVLEIGCGTGATMRWLRGQMNIQYAVGIEIKPEAAVKARDVFDLVLTGNVETLDIQDANFDLVIILDVLEHLIDPWQIVQRLQAAVAPGGSIVASIPNVGHYSVCWPLLRGQWNYDDSGLLDRTHLRFFTERTAIDLMTGNRLTVQQVHRIYQGSIGFRWKSKRLRWYTMRLLRLIMPKNLLTYQYLIRSVAG